MRTPQPGPLLVMALLAVASALLHVSPLILAEHNTPPDRRFTGVMTQSPDMMQYRVWMREAVDSGPIIRNSMTSEPNSAFIPVPFYWAIGEAGAATGTAPDWWYRIFGAILAAALVVFVYRIIGWFFPDPHQRWWTFVFFLLGGAITAALRLVFSSTGLQYNQMVRYVFYPGGEFDGLERSRSVFMGNLLFDPHYLLLWLLLIMCVLSVYRALERATPARLAVPMFLVPFTVFVHIHQIVLLTLIFMGIAVALYSRGMLDRTRVRSLVLIWLPGVLVAGWLASLERRAHLPLPEWRAGTEPLSIVLMGFPVVFGLMIWGLRRYWLEAGLRECVLLGWILACFFLTAAGPFYPFPHRGLITVQLPLTLVAAGIYFANFPRVSRAAMAVILILGAPMILAVVPKRFGAAQFHPGRLYSWATPASDSLLGTLRAMAKPTDVLLANASDRLWLVPAYPGVTYVSHGFLTVRFPEKQYRLDRFMEDSNTTRQAQFLEGTHTRFLFVNNKANPSRFLTVPGLHPIEQRPFGTLFEYAAGSVGPPDKLPYQPIGYRPGAEAGE